MRFCKPSRFSSVLAVLGVLILACIASCAPPVGRAATVWSDDFSDGDYAGWTVKDGTFTAANYRLEDTGGVENIIHHASTVATGTWSFDLDARSPLGFPFLNLYFMASDLDPSSHLPANSYFVNIYQGYLNVFKRVDATSTKLGGYSIGSSVLAVNIDVTRNTAGDLHIWVNGTHQLYYRDTAVSSSTDFVFESSGAVPHWIDNVTVSDTVDIEPPATTTTTTTPIPGFAIPAITLGLVIALATAIVYRRRKR